jgi:uncharacterized protein (TIGR02271 family)
MSETIERMTSLRGKTVYDRSGEKIGKVEDFYLDNDTGEPEWIGIGTGIFNTKHVVVPVEGYKQDGDGISVPYDKDRVKDAPDIDDDNISVERERELYEFYGLRQLGYREPTETYDPGLPRQGRGDATRGDATFDARGTAGENMATDRDASMVRNEEELRVGTRQVEAGHARLRKWVEHETVSQDVPIRRETARVVREPVEGTATGGEIGERQVEMTLRREEPVVQKETVARERVSLEKQTEQTTAHVEDTVAREHIEVDGDVDETTRGNQSRRL